MKARKTKLQKNEEKRYRLPDRTATILGLEINKSKRYRLSKAQEQDLFDIDFEPIKRLFFDIETSPYIGYFWNLIKPIISYDMLKEPMKVICISYKWEGMSQIHRLDWDKNQCDKKMIARFIKIMDEADEIVAHNGDRYDVRVLRTRAVYHRLPMMPKYRTLDTLKKARSGFKFPSNRLDALAQYLGVGAKVKHEGFSMWEKCMQGDLSALKDMGTYCDGDIVVLEDVYLTLQNYVRNNTHVGVHNGKLKASCPNCGSEDVGLLKNQFTAMGTIKRLMECTPCGYNYEISNSAWRTFLEIKQNNMITS